MPRFIVYACPKGELEKQVTACLQLSREIFPANPALLYPPHCTLTGFFEESAEYISLHLKVLDDVMRKGRTTSPEPVVHVVRLIFEANFHGLLLEAGWLKEQIAAYANNLRNLPHEANLRLKDWLHLSLSYNIPTELDAPLRNLEMDKVNPDASAHWDLLFYEHLSDGGWLCHRSWPLGR